MLIDTHSHLYVNSFRKDIDTVINRAVESGVGKIYLPAIDSAETESMLQLEKAYPNICFAMMGLHPCSVKENVESELIHVEEWLAKRKFCAVGEIGLDFYWDKTHLEQQYRSFRVQIEWALHYNLPIVIHTRNAMQETISIVNEYVSKGIRGIFHCFGDSYENARKIIDMGFYLGIGGVVTYKKSGLADVLTNIDLSHMVLETDAPYLTPEPFRGKRNESGYLKYIVEKLSQIKDVSPAEVARITTLNAEKIFGS